jgi:hypothetical protein
MKKGFLTLLLATAFLGGCAFTRIHDITSNIPPGTTYQKIIVHADLADPEAQKIVEDAVVKQFRGIGVTVTASYTLFPPGNTESLDQKKQAIQADGFDAALLVQVLDVSSKSVGPSLSNESDVDMARAHFKIRTKILETKGFTVVWQARSGSGVDTNESGDFSVESLMDSYATAIVGELQKEGIVKASMNLENLFR